MWETALDYAIKSGMGIFTILFVALLWWVLSTNDQREKRYMALADKLSTDLGDRLTSVERDLEALPHKVAESIRAWRD